MTDHKRETPPRVPSADAPEGRLSRPKTENPIHPLSLSDTQGGFSRTKTETRLRIPLPDHEEGNRTRPPTDPHLRNAPPDAANLSRPKTELGLRTLSSDAAASRPRVPTETGLGAITRPKTELGLHAIARPKTELGLRILPIEDSDSSAAFLLTVHPEYLLIEAVGIFTIQDMRAETARAAEVIRQPGQRWNIITDFTHCHVSERGVNEILSEYSQSNRPFVRKSAVLGLSGVKSFFFDMVVRLSSRRDLKPFNAMDDAVAWLREPLQGE